jgi:hypothetical protein
MRFGRRFMPFCAHPCRAISALFSFAKTRQAVVDEQTAAGGRGLAPHFRIAGRPLPIFARCACVGSGIGPATGGTLDPKEVSSCRHLHGAVLVGA